MVAIDAAEVHACEVRGVWGHKADQMRAGDRMWESARWVSGRYDEPWSGFLFLPFYHSTKHDTTIASKA